VRKARGTCERVHVIRRCQASRSSRPRTFAPLAPSHRLSVRDRPHRADRIGVVVPERNRAWQLRERGRDQPRHRECHLTRARAGTRPAPAGKCRGGIGHGCQRDHRVERIVGATRHCLCRRPASAREAARRHPAGARTRTVDRQRDRRQAHVDRPREEPAPSG
jgi:hypothetical protein